MNIEATVLKKILAKQFKITSKNYSPKKNSIMCIHHIFITGSSVGHRG